MQRCVAGSGRGVAGSGGGDVLPIALTAKRCRKRWRRCVTDSGGGEALPVAVEAPEAVVAKCDGVDVFRIAIVALPVTVTALCRW